MTIPEYIKGEVTYDELGPYLWIDTPKDGVQMLAQVRGWGHIKHLFKDQNEAMKFQVQVGEFIADAINEKIKRDFK